MAYLKRYYFFLLSVVFLPTVAWAAVQTYAGVVSVVIDLIKQAVVIIAGLAVLYFGWSIFRNMLAGARGDEKALGEGRTALLYGVIALAALVSIWGLVNLVKATFFP